MTKLGMQRIFCAAALLVLPMACGAGEARKGEDGMVRVEHVEVRATAMGPVVLLKVQNKAIPIFVDSVVAESIQGALTGQKYPRPLTHDLMRSVLEGFDARVTRVVITLKGPTYYADLTVLMRGTVKVFDSRSSDAIALAVHFNAPMLVSQELIDKAGKLPDERAPSRPGVTL